jgi:poly-gamma-glutamate synthesis protein (capsule biosynthesis protein)
VAVGDVMLGRAVEERMLVYGADFPLAALAPLLRQADVTTGNLEGAIAYGGTPLQKTYTFRAHPGLSAAALQGAGLDLLALANNHTLDFGEEGLAEMMATLRGAGIEAVGAGPDAYAPLVLEVNGLRIAFLARNVAVAPQDGVAWAEEAELRQAVAQARSQADLVVVHLHAGIEYSTTADETQRRLAQAAADGGAALVIGHHSHAPQEVEWIGETLVAYSLGDFVFDIDDHDIARDGAVLRVILSRRGVEGAEWIPVRIVDDVQPRPRAGADGRPLIEQIP